VDQLYQQVFEKLSGDVTTDASANDLRLYTAGIGLRHCVSVLLVRSQKLKFTESAIISKNNFTGHMTIIKSMNAFCR